jgi:hypothetical protein
MPDAPSSSTTLIAPDATCVYRGHPVSKNPGDHYCGICTIIWRFGGDAAVAESRKDPAAELEWLFKAKKR